MPIDAIHTEVDYRETLESIAELFFSAPGTPEHDEFCYLVSLVEAYEDEYYPI